MAPKKKTAAPATTQPTLFDQLKPASENLLLKLPISDAKMDELLHHDDMQMILEYNPTMSEPTPYDPDQSDFERLERVERIERGAENNAQCELVEKTDAMATTKNSKNDNSRNEMCYWCCHSINDRVYGMPIRYDPGGTGGLYGSERAFSIYGSFCSLQCVAAHNFSVHGGSDRAFEINSWIQMLSRRHGFEGAVRPAPSRYLLKMFGGSLSIEEFRNAHCNPAKTYVLNIPPMISVPSQMESVNTSFATRP
jgi:hypothetical protein